MRVPEIIHSDGRRRYDNDSTKLEDLTRCAVGITDDGRGREVEERQCYNPRTHGIYCEEHLAAFRRIEAANGSPPEIHPKEITVSLKSEDDKARYVIDYHRLAVTVAMTAVELETNPDEEGSRARFKRAVAAWRRFTEPKPKRRKLRASRGVKA